MTETLTLHFVDKSVEIKLYFMSCLSCLISSTFMTDFS